ncbi:MAG: hypothetical protein IJ374_07665, partial [Lachnospiraceae bacterium]|nr:hypothetical protein [Lachnospiraceae bacterium]
MRMKWKKTMLVAMLAVTLCASVSALAGEIESRKLSILQVEGTEAVIKKQNGRDVKAVKGMNLGEGNKVSTGNKTYVYI